MLVLYQVFLFVTCLSLQSATLAKLAKPGCLDKCGNLTIPYPFGVELGCSLDPSFNIFCDDTFEPPKPYLRVGKVQVQYNQSGAAEVIGISDTQVRLRSPMIASKCYDQHGNTTTDISVDIDFSSSSFTLSATNNKLTLIGCDDNIYTFLTPTGGDCRTSCASITDVKEGCSPTSGKGCCQSAIPIGLQEINAQPTSTDGHAGVFSFNRCSYVFLGDVSSFTFRGASDLSDPTFVNRTIDSVPIVLDWQIGNQSCSDVEKTAQYPCLENSHCVDSDTGRGYRCVCNTGFAGNPYLTPGCQDIDECAYSRASDNYPCAGICSNTEGNYTCSCPHGYFGDGKKNGTGCNKKPSEVPVLKISLGSGLGVLALLVCFTSLYLTMKKRKLLRLREKFFKQNGGLLLKQRLSSSSEDAVVSTRIFTSADLENATNNFAQSCILGQGGSGTVYKGTLPDKRVVAIKKSKFIDKTQIEEFINEVIILTQINHRNVVKLLGCCLETEVPLLVYEYVSKGTLQHQIDKNTDKPWLSWDNRLRIGIEAASALSYLHSAASMPIIHRDVKSANILLDNNFTAKISDFGASRLVPLDQTRINTLVQGTLGYLDPEYFQTGDLTDKSDVYSFGVVLAELLTGKRPLRPLGEEGSLAKLMISSVQENSLFKILDHRILKEASFEQLNEVAKLIVRCLHLKGEERPTMREVATELESIKRLTKNQWAPHGNNAGDVQLTEESDLYATSLI